MPANTLEIITDLRIYSSQYDETTSFIEGEGIFHRLDYLFIKEILQFYDNALGADKQS
jgi:hypothetical protein